MTIVLPHHLNTVAVQLCEMLKCILADVRLSRKLAKVMQVHSFGTALIY